MNYREYNKKIFTLLFGLILFVGVLNITVDPYNIFNFPVIKRFNYFKPDAKRQERLTKFINLKTIKEINTIFVGLSRTAWSLEAEYYNKITGKNASNMAMSAADFYEFKEIVYNSIKIHPEIDTILLAVDMQRYMPIIADKTSSKINIENSKITPNEIANVVFSVDTTVSSFVTLIKNLSGVEKKVYLSNGMKHMFYNKNIRKSFEEIMHSNSDFGIKQGKEYKNVEIDLTELKNFINELNSKNIKVILYIPPLHVTFFEILDYNNIWDIADEFKKELAKIQPFYDFMYVHPINVEKIAPDMKYYFEASHSTFIVGRKVLDKIFNNEGDFGVLVTEQNIDAHNKNNRNNLKLWQKENLEIQEWVHEILSKS